MLDRRRLILCVIILLIAFTVAGVSLYQSGAMPWFRGDLPNCLRMEDGTARLEVRYPDQFIGWGSSRDIRVIGRDPADPSQPTQGDYIFTVSSFGYAESLNYLLHPHQGPTFYPATFNGHEAGLYQFTAGSILWYDYAIPVGDDMIDVSYRFSELTPDEQTLVRKMVNTVSISQSTETVDPPRVTKC